MALMSFAQSSAPQTLPTHLFCDNQATLHISSDPIFHERTKYIEIDCHFVYNELLAQKISPTYVPTEVQPADIFTKALDQS